jgi:DNA (cytosine-5)-methyltransferase 1
MRLIFVEILRELKACGYAVSARLLNAMYFGVPQSRERMIFIGVRDDLGIAPTHPGAISAVINLKKMPDSPNANKWLTPERCQSILEHGPKQKAKGNSFHPIFLTDKAPFPTIPKTRSGNGSLYFAEGNRFRYPTGEELKYGGSYPARFQFAGEDANIQNRIGNSVPPLFMRSIAQHIRREILDKVKR